MKIKSILLPTILVTSIGLAESVIASSLVIGEGGSSSIGGTFGFTSGLTGPGNPDPIIVSASAQSFLAIDPFFTSVSMPLMAQTQSDVGSNNVVFWEFQLWGDDNGKPGQVIESFGSFDPGDNGFETFTASPNNPISLVTGNRYYLGISPIGDLLSPPTDAIFALVQQECSLDCYTDGQVWSIQHNRYVLGETVITPQSANFNMTINFSAVPIPSAVWLFGSGLICLIGLTRCKANI